MDVATRRAASAQEPPPADRAITDPAVARRLLELFVNRCQRLADDVRMGHIGFLDAVYIAADAAQYSGLADGISDERLQRAIGFAFMGPLQKRATSAATTTASATTTAPGGGA